MGPLFFFLVSLFHDSKSERPYSQLWVLWVVFFGHLPFIILVFSSVKLVSVLVVCYGFCSFVLCIWMFVFEQNIMRYIYMDGGDPIELFLFHIEVVLRVYQMEFFLGVVLIFCSMVPRVALNVSWSQIVI